MENVHTIDILSHIFNMVEGPDNVLKEMKENISILNQMVSSHSMSIKQMEAHMALFSHYKKKQQYLVTDEIRH